MEAPAAARKWRRVKEEVTGKPNALSIMIFSRTSPSAAKALRHNPRGASRREMRRQV
jgi:hypothetical protein